MCVCEWDNGRVVSMCGAHFEAARRHAEIEVKMATLELLTMVKDLASVCILLRNDPMRAYGVVDLLIEAEKLIQRHRHAHP